MLITAGSLPSLAMCHCGLPTKTQKARLSEKEEQDKKRAGRQELEGVINSNGRDTVKKEYGKGLNEGVFKVDQVPDQPDT